MPDEPVPTEPTPDEPIPDEPGQPAEVGDGIDEDVDEAGGEAAQDTRPHPRGEGATALARLQGDIPRPRPPRRTGVFLDPDDLREHVGSLLRVFLGGYEVDTWGNFTFTHEGARVFVTVGQTPIGPQVGVFSVTNLDIDLTPQLAGFLLTTNHRLGFGSFSYDTDNEAVWLRHTLHGPTLDGPELQSAVGAVASAAAHFDDVIQDRFGGATFESAPEDVQRRTHPPEAGSQDQHPSPGGAGGYL